MFGPWLWQALFRYCFPDVLREALYRAGTAKDIAEMAKRSVAYNEKEDKVHIAERGYQEATSIFEAASFDVITSNPPYLNQSMVVSAGVTQGDCQT